MKYTFRALISFLGAFTILLIGSGQNGFVRSTAASSNPIAVLPGTTSFKADDANPSLPTLPQLKVLVDSGSESAKLAKSDPIGYGWQLFFYTAWPGFTDLAHRGQPDPSKKLGQPGPTSWEMWKNSDEIFLPNGHKPEVWNTAEPVPAEVSKQPFKPSDTGNYWENMTGNTEVDGFPAKDDTGQDILYEIRMNQDIFTPIVTRELFNIDGQIKYANEKGDLVFPFGVMEIKASWRWLDTTKPGCQAADYFTANAYWKEKDRNGKPMGYKTGVMGMTGLHVLTKALNQWVWITFEQVNNTICTQVERRDPIPTDVQEANKKWRTSLAGTKWAKYEMVGVQTSPGTAQKPILLANTQIETAFQSRSSCLTCHSIASIATQKPTKPEDDLRKSFLQHNPPVSPPYYIGTPPALAPFKSQDFVWSLRRAAWFQK